MITLIKKINIKNIFFQSDEFIALSKSFCFSKINCSSPTLIKEARMNLCYKLFPCFNFIISERYSDKSLTFKLKVIKKIQNKIEKISKKKKKIVEKLKFVIK